MEPRLKQGDLVRVRKGMTFRGKKIKAKDNGILLEMKFVNGLSLGQVYWQQTQLYSDDMPTEHLIRVEDVQAPEVSVEKIKKPRKPRVKKIKPEMAAEPTEEEIAKFSAQILGIEESK